MNRTISAGRTPGITIESVGGDLSIVGWEGEDLLIKGDEDEMRFSQDGDKVVVSSSDDLSLRVPRMASLNIQMVGGDMALRGLNGDVHIAHVGGDASIREVNNLSIGTVEADLSLRTAKGNVEIKSVNSDGVLRDIHGSVSVESIGDDLVLRDVRGSLSVNVGSDVVAYLDPQAGATYSINAGDDVMLILPPYADTNLVLSGDQIVLDWPGFTSDEEETSRLLTLGNGSANITISAGGELRVSSQEKAEHSPEEFGNFAGMMFDWGELGNQIGARISRKVEEASRKAAGHAERAARKAEAKLRGRGPRGKVNMGRWEWNIDSSTISPPTPPREPVAEEERLAILKMLAEKKITADEADKLLSALEGGS